MVTLINRMFNKFRKVITHAKILVSRTQSYTSMISAGMILFLVLGKLKDFGVDINLTKWFIPIYIVSMAGVFLIGYVDNMFGFYEQEQKLRSEKNPYFVEILSEIKKVNKRLDKLERKK